MTAMDPAMASSEVLTAPRRLDPPPLSSVDFWTDAQWAVFMAIMDTIVPAVVPESSLTDEHGQLGVPDAEYLTASKTARDEVAGVSTEEALTAYLEDRPSTNQVVRRFMLQLIARLPAKRRDGLGKLMSSLSCVHPKALLESPAKGRILTAVLICLNRLQLQH